jgi:plastocyanin
VAPRHSHAGGSAYAGRVLARVRGIVSRVVRRALAIATAAALTPALSSCGEKDETYAKPAPPGGAVRAKPSVSVVERSFELKPKDGKASRPGQVTIEIRNADRIDHALAVEGGGVTEESTIVPPGETSNLTIQLKRAKYRWYCPVPGHAGKGMKGTLTVG